MLASNKNPLERIWNKLYRDLYRDPKRVKIAGIISKTAPSPKSDLNLPYSVHTLISKKNLIMGIWSAKSLNLACQQPLPWIFHDDGSLQENDFLMLRYHFPGCKVIERTIAENEVNKLRKEYPLTLKMRDQHVLMMKIVDLGIFSEKERILFVDSDILFFKEPTQLISLLNTEQISNFFNKDVQSCYLYGVDTIKDIAGILIPEKINSGLSILNKEIIKLEYTELLLNKFPLTSNLIYHRLEQTLIMLLSAMSPYGANHLEETYDVVLNKEIKSTVCKHYVGVIRQFFELEGLQYLIKEQNFIERWQQFSATH